MEIILNLIEQWLKGRAQRVGIGGELSKWLEVLSGVPQGSVLLGTFIIFSLYKRPMSVLATGF